MTTSNERVLLIGLGAAGSRFERSLRVLEAEGDVDFQAVCDLDPARLESVLHRDRYQNITEACRTVAPTAVVVAVNDHAHASVIKEVIAATKEPPRRIACEKPLTTSLAELEDLASSLELAGHSEICVNYVEQFSPALQRFLEWMNETGAKPMRLEFFWGKNRIGDPRPTMGALSELSHPLDLSRVILGGSPDLDVTSVHGLRSNYLTGADLIESLDVQLSGSDIEVTGHCSFGWPRRDRRIAITLMDGRDTWYAELQFDRPYWDADTLTIKKWDRASGGWIPDVEFAVSNGDYGSEQFQLGKVIAFLKYSLHQLKPDYRIDVGIEASRWISNKLDQIDAHAAGNMRSVHYKLRGSGRAGSLDQS